MAGGMAYLSHLVSITPTSVHAEDYADIVSRTATMRKLISQQGSKDRRAGLRRHRRPGHHAAPRRGRALRRQEHHAAAPTSSPSGTSSTATCRSSRRTWTTS